MLVQIRSGSGLPLTGTTSTDWTSEDLSGRVPRFAILGRAIDLDELCKAADLVVERRGDRRTVRSEAVRCDLEFVARCGVTQPFDENVRRRLVALAEGDVEHEFGMPLNRHQRVGVAKILIVLGANAFLLFPDVRPQLVTFHVAYFHVDDLARHDAV